MSLLGVAAGRIGAIKTLEHLRSVCSHVGAIVLPRPVSVAGVRKAFDEEGNCTDEDIEEMLRDLADTTMNYVKQTVCPRKILEEMSREEELDEWEQTLDERERGLKQIRAELDDREEQLEEDEAEIQTKRQTLQSREAELNEWETKLEERTADLDEREAAIETQEDRLAERAEKLDEHEQILERYVDDRVSESLDGRIDRMETVVGDRIVALEEEVGENIQEEVTKAFNEQERTSPLGLATSVVLGVVGIALVAAGVTFAFAGDIGSVPMLLSDTTTNTAASGLLVLLGIAATLTATTGRV
jgi:hypothetical protein